MPALNNFSIRKYAPGDREAVRKIAYETSLLERPELFVEDEEIVADALTLYFTDYEPEACFVADHGGTVVGYLTGAKNAEKMLKTFNSKITWRLLRKAARKGLLIKVSFLKFAWQIGISMLKGEFRMPPYSKQFQALYHINLAKEYRGGGIGGRLVKEFERYLIDNHINSVHVGTMTDGAKEFFVKNGYRILFKSQRSYLRHKTQEIIPFYVLGKELDFNNRLGIIDPPTEKPYNR